MANQGDIKTATEANRKAWDISAKHHRDTDLWREILANVAHPDFSCFDTTMTRALTKMKLSGKSAVQIGCNNGREALSLPAFGMKSVLGIDQSGSFIDQAHELGEIAQKPVNFLCADIYNLPPRTPHDFDLAMITIGVLSWMPDLPRFFATVANLLNDKGQLIIYETHPVLEMFNPNGKYPLRPEYSYFETKPSIETEVITYDGSAQEGGAESYWYTHTLSHIFTSILNAGLHITQFEEFAHSNREVDYAIYEKQAAQVPMCYLLEAAK
jgi:SAM-dependent methyltransferase